MDDLTPRQMMWGLLPLVVLLGLALLLAYSFAP
jgi:hypothetical protein